MNNNRRNDSGNRGSYGGGRNRGSGGGGYGRRGSGPRQMHKAVCAECGNNCEVPFRPTGDKPVYCSNCFEKHDGGGRDSRARSGGHSDGTSKQVLEQLISLNQKLDKIIDFLMPTSKAKKPKKPKADKTIEEPTPENESPKDSETPGK
ncbi:CxxC-x17-CxxC domain-containing protein [Patescibacteria group bacterium]